jgi:hypothetical protein
MDMDIPFRVNSELPLHLPNFALDLVRKDFHFERLAMCEVSLTKNAKQNYYLRIRTTRDIEVQLLHS